MKNDGFCGGGKEMNQKTLKKSLVALLVGIMLLSQSVYADSLALAAEVPVAEETIIENAETPDAEADVIEDVAGSDVEEAVTENAPLVDADAIHEMGEDAPVHQDDDTVAVELYMREKAAKKWNKKQSLADEPELVGADDTDAPWNGGEATDLSLNETYEVHVEDRASVWFRFVPEETGNYKFYSFGNESGDPYANLYDTEGDYLYDDDDGATGEDVNFAIRGTLTEDETYYFEATSYTDGETVYSVSIEQVPTVVAFTPTLAEGAHLVKESLRSGDWVDADEPYFEYYDTAIQELFSIEYTLSDGTTGEWVYAPRSNYYIVGDSEVIIEFDSESAVVGINTAVMSIDGVERTIQFEIIELPELESAMIVNNSDAERLLVGWVDIGYWDTDDAGDEYFCFYQDFIMNQFVIHATYVDETEIDWEWDPEAGNDYLDEKYPITVETFYEEGTVLLNISVGDFENLLEFETTTFEEVSNGAITDAEEFGTDGDEYYTVYTFTAPQDGQYDVSVASEYEVSLYIFDESNHQVDTEATFYQQDGYTETLSCTGGQNYYFLVEDCDESDQVDGTLSVQEHVSVTNFTAVNDGFVPTVGNEEQGYYDENDPTVFIFYNNYVARAFSIHLTFDDGTTGVWRYDGTESMSVRNNNIEFSQITNPPYETENRVVRIKIGNITQIAEFVVSGAIPESSNITSLSVDFNGKMHLITYIKLSDEVMEDEDAYITTTLNGVTTNHSVAELVRYLDSRGRAKVRQEMYAAMLRDEMTLQVFNGAGEVQPLTYKDSMETTDCFAYAALEYLKERQQNSANPKMVALARAAELYGAAVQVHFNYHIDQLTAEEIAAVEATAEAISIPTTCAETLTGALPVGVSKRTMTVMFESDNTLRQYFYIDDANIGNYTFTLNGNTVAPSRKESGKYYVEQSNIASGLLSNGYTFAVSDGTDTFMIDSSVLGYAYNRQEKSSSISMVRLSKLLYQYSQAADAYFG